MKFRLVIELDLSTTGKARYSAEVKNLDRPGEPVGYDAIRRALTEVVADLEKKSLAKKVATQLAAREGRSTWIDSLRATAPSEPSLN
jgi:hypothetical protein